MLACEPSGLALLGRSVQGLGKNFPQSINGVKAITVTEAAINF